MGRLGVLWGFMLWDLAFLLHSVEQAFFEFDFYYAQSGRWVLSVLCLFMYQDYGSNHYENDT